MHAKALRCLRCGSEYAPGAMFKGCPRCREEGKPTNLSVVYDEGDLSRSLGRRQWDKNGISMWKYRDLLPVDEEYIVTLGEGWTPLIPVPRLAQTLGVPHLYVKDESRNPTGSFKDRLASVAVSMARQMGAQVITGSSSGNHGAAAAAFSSRAGLPCVMFTTQQFPMAMKTQMAALGAYLLAAPTIKDRWALVEEGVDNFGWFPVTVFGYPLVGSNYYGIEGYKTIAYEIVDQLGRAPEHVVVPCGAGDALTGAWKGFSEYRDAGLVERMPKMHAAEVFGPLEHALTNDLDYPVEVPMGSEPTVAVSVGANFSTYQALHVLRETHGGARSATNTEMLQAQADLAKFEGIYVEASSALTLAALPQMIADGLVNPAETVVLVLTSTGLKDPEITATSLPPVPECGTTLSIALQVLSEVYNFDGDSASP